MVSNHGGRQLSHEVSTLDALPGVVKAVGKKAEVYLDGGIRQGSDVLVALALGARAVTVGRPIMYGLAIGGGEGVTRVLSWIRDELRDTAGLCGVTNIQRLPADLVVRSGPPPEGGAQAPGSAMPERVAVGTPNPEHVPAVRG